MSRDDHAAHAPVKRLAPESQCRMIVAQIFVTLAIFTYLCNLPTYASAKILSAKILPEDSETSKSEELRSTSFKKATRLFFRGWKPTVR